jgi:hypothetical protein
MHIGETAMRFRKVTSLICRGENKWLGAKASIMVLLLLNHVAGPCWFAIEDSHTE